MGSLLWHQLQVLILRAHPSLTLVHLGFKNLIFQSCNITPFFLFLPEKLLQCTIFVWTWHQKKVLCFLFSFREVGKEMNFVDAAQACLSRDENTPLVGLMPVSKVTFSYEIMNCEKYNFLVSFSWDAYEIRMNTVQSVLGHLKLTFVEGFSEWMPSKTRWESGRNMQMETLSISTIFPALIPCMAKKETLWFGTLLKTG